MSIETQIRTEIKHFESIITTLNSNITFINKVKYLDSTINYIKKLSQLYIDIFNSGDLILLGTAHDETFTYSTKHENIKKNITEFKEHIKKYNDKQTDGSFQNIKAFVEQTFVNGILPTFTELISITNHLVYENSLCSVNLNKFNKTIEDTETIHDDFKKRIVDYEREIKERIDINETLKSYGETCDNFLKIATHNSKFSYSCLFIMIILVIVEFFYIFNISSSNFINVCGLDTIPKQNCVDIIILGNISSLLSFTTIIGLFWVLYNMFNSRYITNNNEYLKYFKKYNKLKATIFNEPTK